MAEDNLVNQKVLQKVLQRVTPNSPIFIANNGQEALKVNPQHSSPSPSLAIQMCESGLEDGLANAKLCLPGKQAPRKRYAHSVSLRFSGVLRQ